MTTYYDIARSTGLAFWRRVRQSDFVYNTVSTFGTRLLLIGIGLITSVIIARILGPEGRGAYAAAMAVVGIGVQFGNLGLHASNTYYVSHDRTLLSQLVSNTLVISLGLGGLGVSIAWLVFFIWPSIAPLQGYLLVFALLWIPIGLADLLLQNLLLGIYEIRIYNIIALLTKILAATLLIGVILINRSSVEIVFITGFIAALVSCVWTLSRLVANGSQPTLPSLEIFYRGIRYGFKAYLAAFFGFMVLRVDLLMVKQMLGVELAGYYSIAANMIDMIYMLPVVAGTLLFPKLSAMSSEHEKWFLTKNIAVGVTLGVSILVLFAGILAKPVVLLLYGQEFLPSVPAFIYLLPAIVAMSINTIFMNYFAALGMPMITVYSPGVAALANILLNLWLIPAYGIIGASISSVVAYFLMLLFSSIYICYFRGGLHDYELSR